jgi:hypothetical protein
MSLINGTQLATDLGLTSASVAKLATIQAGGKSGQNHKNTVSIPIVGGTGTLTSPSQTSFGVTLKGSATIVAPTDPPGVTWAITATDVEAGATVFSGAGLVAGQVIPINYSTGFYVQLKVETTSTPPITTTLVVGLDVDV